MVGVTMILRQFQFNSTSTVLLELSLAMKYNKLESNSSACLFRVSSKTSANFMTFKNLNFFTYFRYGTEEPFESLIYQGLNSLFA